MPRHVIHPENKESSVDHAVKKGKQNAFATETEQDRIILNLFISSDVNPANFITTSWQLQTRSSMYFIFNTKYEIR